MSLEVESLRLERDAAVLLDGVSFRLQAGERLGIVGEAGSGKSLLALALAGLLPAGLRQSGEVRLAGEVLQPLRLDGREARPVAIVRHGVERPLPAMRRVAELLPDIALVERLGLDPLKRAARLTRSERLLVEIGLALAAPHKLLVLDDALIGLDALALRRVVDLLSGHSAPLILLGHDLPAMAALTQTLLFLERGRIVERGDTGVLLSRPMEDYSRHLVAGARVRARTLMRTPIGGPLLEARGVTLMQADPDRLLRRRPSVAALADVSFVLRRGEALAVVGASGSGKSSLARLVAGLGRSHRGDLLFDGHHRYRGSDLPAAVRPEISLVFPDPRRAFDPDQTIGASIAEPLLLDEHHTLEEQTDRLMDVLRGVGLAADALDRLPASFSLYELHLAALARALVNRPRLVVLDEPVQLLNAAERNEMLTLINRVRADFGFSALITASSLDLVRSIADRVLVLDRGRLVEDGKPGDLIDAPGAEATRALVEARLPHVGIGVVAPVGR